MNSPPRRRRRIRPSRLYSSEAAALAAIQHEQRLRFLGGQTIVGPLLTDRQRRAMELPLYPEDGPNRWEGNLVDHTVDPRHRVVEMHVEPHRTEWSTYDPLGRDRTTERKRYQLWSTLTVDMESGPLGPQPMWHAAVGWYANVGEEAWTVDRWATKKRGHWMHDRAVAKVAELIPDFRTRVGNRGIPENRLSLHFRSPLSLEEQAVFGALKKPRIYAAPPGVRRALALEQGVLPNRTLGE